MLTDYKIIRITEHDDGHLVVVVRFYEGAITTEDENHLGRVIPITRYRRTRILRKRVIRLATSESYKQLQQRLNHVLAMDTIRRPISEQADV